MTLRRLMPMLLVAAAAFSSAAAPATDPISVAAASNAAQRLHRLYEAEWAWRQREFGRVAGHGSGAAADYLPRVDPASQRRRLEYWQRALAELGRIPAADLSAEDRINAAVFRAQVEALANDVRFGAYEAPFNSDTFFWSDVAPGGAFADAEEYRRYLGRLRDLPRYFDEQIANMRAGIARGFTVPRVTLEGRDRTMEPFLAAGEANPLFAPFRTMPASVGADQQARLRAEALTIIREGTAPAYRRLLTMFRDEYLPRARATIAARDLPNGEVYYQAMIRDYSTLEISPREIHEIGLREVTRIHAEMEATMRRTGYQGTLAQFITFLRTDPQFYARTPRELLAAAAYVVKKADGQLGETIGTLPRYRHGIIPVPDEIAPVYTGGRGGLENCLFNTYNLPARPLYTLPALALHECTPGHSFQAALALEGPNRPEFRQEAYFSGYSEGWGLYVEWLGTRMGIYETPYEDFGRLTYEMWRAARLVIDTGIHAFGWSRERAVAYLRDHTALAELEINNEIDRYISWPGQAVSYKLGELQIRRLRAEAERRLGTGFDQRRFHDAILELGSVPLPVLEEHVHEYIEREMRAH